MNEKTSYTAIEKLGEINKSKFGIKYPTDESMFEFTTQRIRKSAHSIAEEKRSDLEKEAVEFIRNRCVGLRFKKDEYYLNLEDREGKSLKCGELPYNVQMDLDRRCLEVAIHRFMESGTAKDAFDIYYIYLEMPFILKNTIKKLPRSYL